MVVHLFHATQLIQFQAAISTCCTWIIQLQGLQSGFHVFCNNQSKGKKAHQELDDHRKIEDFKDRKSLFFWGKFQESLSIVILSKNMMWNKYCTMMKRKPCHVPKKVHWIDWIRHHPPKAWGLEESPISQDHWTPNKLTRFEFSILLEVYDTNPKVMHSLRETPQNYQPHFSIKFDPPNKHGSHLTPQLTHVMEFGQSN